MQVDKGRLAHVDIVVIKNALADVNVERWSLPTPSAFTVKELDTLEDWVREGGGLILVVDHMPVAGAGRDLLSRFGVTISNGFAAKSERLDGYEPSDVMKATNLRFCRDDSLDGLINSHPINDEELGSPINLVLTSGGSAFRLPEHGEPLLTFGPGTTSLVPEVSWEFDDDTPRIDVNGWVQAGVVRIGHGRVAVLGDSQPLTVPAYFDGPPTADNVDFTLNLFRWISARP